MWFGFKSVLVKNMYYLCKLLHQSRIEGSVVHRHKSHDMPLFYSIKTEGFF